jgi:Phosphotransferase enzyme family
VSDENASVRPGQLLSAVRAETGLDLVQLSPTGAGESGTTFWVKDRDGTVSLLKIGSGPTPEPLEYLRALDAVTGRLRARGYPAPRLRAIGQAAGQVFWVQERLPGAVLESSRQASGRPALVRLLPQLTRLNDAQAGLGDGQGGWPELLVRTLTYGGDGYCLHSTLESRPGLRDLLGIVRHIGDSCGPAIPPGRDFVHFDFTLANLLTDGTAVTGVIDVNPPLLTGDRAFDLATLLFYCYDHDDIRDHLRARLLQLTDYRAARAYLAHMVLRQVDWSLRHHPKAKATQHHLALARLVVADIAAGPLS